jgi:hypothetical protein
MRLRGGAAGRQPLPKRLGDSTVAEDGWLLGDVDADGLENGDELRHGCNPYGVDTNGDGVNDAVSVAIGRSCSDPDLDHDRLSNADELRIGANPLDPDTDHDGVMDGADCRPLDPTVWTCPVPNPDDHTPPVITLLEPANALPLP